MNHDTLVERETLKSGVVLEMHFDHDCECPMERDDKSVFLAYYDRYQRAGFPHKDLESALNRAQSMREEPKDFPDWHIFMLDYRDFGSSGCKISTTTNEDRANGVIALAVSEWPKRKDAEKYADAVLKEYEQWACGECYGHVIKDRSGNIVESCWGFIGYDYALAEARSIGNAIDLDALERQQFYKAIGM